MLKLIAVVYINFQWELHFALGVKDVHRLGFSHNDLTAGNLFVMEEQMGDMKVLNLVIGDFGKASREATTAERVSSRTREMLGGRPPNLLLLGGRRPPPLQRPRAHATRRRGSRSTVGRVRIGLGEGRSGEQQQ